VDAEAENYNSRETVAKIMSYSPERVIILATGSHPSAHIQAKDEMIKLSVMLEGKTNVETHSSLFIDPCKWGPPRWELLDMSKYRTHNWHSWSNGNIRIPYGAIFTSISCPMKCEFCTVKSFYGNQYQARLIEDVTADFDTLSKLDIKNIKVMDELFVFNPYRVHAICDDIIGRGYEFNIWAYARIDIMNEKLLKKMKKAGINWLAYGIETGSEEIRQNVLKGNFDNNKIREVIKMTKDCGINALGNYMFGFWDDNLDTMQQTFDLATELQCEYSNFYCVVAYPDSELYNQMVERKVSMPTDYIQYSQMSENFKPLPTRHLKAEEVLKFRDNAFNSYYTNQDYLKMMLIKFGSDVVQDIGLMSNKKIKRNGY
jgi:radical SAM superfamily enzyme YgiQ (UPF0313 family)